MHEHYEHSEFVTGGAWLLIAIVAVLVGLGALLWFWFWNRPQPPAKQPEGEEKPQPEKATESPKDAVPTEKSGGQSLTGVAGEIFNMLRLHGGSMTQLEIAQEVGVEQEEIAETLDILEARGCIERRWNGEKSTFRVSVAEG
jgi:hypothetical protein